MAMKQISVDDLPVEVDEAEYDASPESVFERVRAARAEMTGDLSDLFETGPDYDTLVAAFGEDETTEVPDAGQ